jgi:hypothetical protein
MHWVIDHDNTSLQAGAHSVEVPPPALNKATAGLAAIASVMLTICFFP